MGIISPLGTDTNGNVKQTGSLQILGEDDFLQLMITKLENQDPLNPMSDEDYIAQLAQFSSLEQLNFIADGLASANEWDYLQMQSINNVMASSFIGKDVRAVYSGVYVDAETNPTITYTLDSAVDSVEFVIKDSSGMTVATLTQDSVSRGVNSITWDGTDSMGNRVDEGYYYVEATATTAAGNKVTPSLSLEGTVDAVIYRDGSAYLRVNGTEIALGDVSTIAEKGAYASDSDDSE
ncbi:MAG: flagellar hook capping FlgD N-terminal domain-containing protein [Candidatus Zixiibacteriota bacterium]